MDTAQHMLDHMMVHVEEPVAVHRISFTDEVPAGRWEGREGSRACKNQTSEDQHLRPYLG